MNESGDVKDDGEKINVCFDDDSGVLGDAMSDDFEFALSLLT